MPADQDIAIVTGASSGIGRRFAEVLADQGVIVCCLARRKEVLDDLVQSIRDKGETAYTFTFDAAVVATCDAVVDQIVATVGTPTLLVNNAGVSVSTRAEKMPVEQYDWLMSVNLRAPWRLSQICATRWIAEDIPGRIINVSSVLGKRVQKGVAAYCMSKAALTHMTAALAVEWARYGIRVNALCPGYIKTEINADFWDQPIGQAEFARLPRRRVEGPEMLDQALLFLSDRTNTYTNGEALTVDDAQGWVL